MRALTWWCALLLAVAPVTSVLAQSQTSKPSSSRRKKKPKTAPKPKPAPEAPAAAPPAAAEPTDAPVQEDDDSGPQWETEEDEQAKQKQQEAASKAAERARAAAEKKQAAAVEQARIEEAVKWRRTMLTVHQGLGVATWLSLAGTTVIGQLELQDKYRGGTANPDRFERLHFGLAMGSTALFAATGLMGLLAPRAYVTKPGFSTVTLHKLLLAIATAGMLAQVGLGLYAHTREGDLDQRTMVQAHQIIGYGTLGALTVGAAVLFF